MPITISEYIKSRRLIQSPGGEATFERIFTIQGTDDPAAAQDVGPQLGDVHAGTLVAIRRELEVLAARGEQGALRLTVQYVAARIRPDGPTPSFEWQADRFPQLPPAADFPFDLVVTDMDLDGDPDLLVNWHHLGRPELFDNRRGRFALLNPSGADASGLFDNRGIPDLFAKATEMIAEIDAEGKPGVYLWHDLNRHGAWNFYVLPQAPVQLSIRTNNKFYGPLYISWEFTGKNSRNFLFYLSE